MANASARELRIHTRAVLARVESGESITITVNDRPVARLEPMPRRRRWMSREAFIREVLPHQADPGLREELRTMLPDVDRPSEVVEDGRADRTP